MTPAEQLAADVDALGAEIVGRPMRVLSFFGREAIDLSTVLPRLQAILRRYGDDGAVETVLEYYAAESRIHLEFRDVATGRRLHTFEDVIEKLTQRGALAAPRKAAP